MSAVLLALQSADPGYFLMPAGAAGREVLKNSSGPYLVLLLRSWKGCRIYFAVLCAALMKVDAARIADSGSWRLNVAGEQLIPMWCWAEILMVLVLQGTQLTLLIWFCSELREQLLEMMQAPFCCVLALGGKLQTEEGYNQQLEHQNQQHSQLDRNLEPVQDSNSNPNSEPMQQKNFKTSTAKPHSSLHTSESRRL
ncbi:hypothetical protein Nepgr_006705 [Nepenthes gracilis]|uniref:Uncharacterized protein n=1 Tax=Nepenthes gracilis TaxID=150966 RepID=A0AAD3S5Y1_NEPGR|nr:hypothetical protein Nepgr_006705 [Nepenthes gracilis]